MADITHQPMEQLQDLEYCIDSNPPWAETILLAFQNYILMLGTSVMIPSMLVPAMGGSSGDKAQVIQTLLFVAGINTLLQALFGTRLPAVVGGSFAYVIPIAHIISDSSLQRINDPHERRFEKSEWERLKLDGVNFRSIGQQHNNFVVARFVENEARDAVWECNSEKSLGPDGLNFKFIKEFLDDIKSDLFRFLDELRVNGVFLKGVNHSSAPVVVRLVLKEILQSDWFAEIFTNNASYTRSSNRSLKHSDSPGLQSSMGSFLKIFQSSWHGTCSWTGWIRVNSTRISCGRRKVILYDKKNKILEHVLNLSPEVLGNCVEIGIPMLLLVVGLSQYLKHVRPFRDIPIFERFPVLICVTIVWIYSVILTASGAYRHKPTITQNSCRTDRANLISTAPWFMFPYPLQWGPPTFSAGHSFAMMSAVIVSMVESTGAYKAASRLAIATPPPAYVLSRGIGWQGIGILLDGLYGTGTGSTVSVENVGLLGLTRVGSRRVVQISAGFMIFFSTLGKFGAVFASIPFPIFAALYCVLFGLVAAVGISFLQFTNMNSMRNLIITGLTLFLGISVPQFSNQYWTSSHHGPVHTNAGWFNAFLNTIFSSPATVGLIVAVLLDNTLEVERSKKDRGMPWWVKFRTFRGDNRNEEFYTLPFNLNRFFPPT
ncbi:Nucleobase-ascorbate transporter 1 [Glycine soja]